MTRIIVVPTRATFAATLPVRFGHCQDVEGKPLIMNGHVDLPGEFLYDPLNDYMEWFGARIYATVTDVSLRERFWTQSHLSQWIEANMSETVLVQRLASSAEWKLCFCSMQDHNKFGKWYHGGGKYTFRFNKGSEALFNEIKKWMEENLSRDGYETVRSYGSSYGNGQISFTMRVKDKTEAAAFKLRWHGVEAEMAE